MLFRQFFDSKSSTYTYLIADESSGEAAFIDPVKECIDSYQQVLRELGLELKLAIDTHVHADHVTALGALRDATQCVTVMGRLSKAACVSRTVAEGDVLAVGGLELRVMETPGHTDDSVCYLMPDRVFTGDTLLIRSTGRTDFQNGSAHDSWKSLQRLMTLRPDTLVYPAHDYKGWTVSTIGEEQAHNPRIKVGSQAAYVHLMENLDLPDPKLMDIAVPANLSCGNA